MSNGIASLLAACSPTLSVGVLSADLSNLSRDLRMLENGGAKLLHFDVMDGRFVSPMTVGAPFVKAVRSTMLKDVHLMIDNPLPRLAEYAAAGADMITLHVEAETHVHEALQRIRELPNANDPARGIARGLAINPGTPLDALEPLLDETDIVFLLAVNPSAPKKVFIESSRERFLRLKQMLAGQKRRIFAAIDGGIHRENIASVAALGADIVVSGSAVFSGQDSRRNLQDFLNTLRPPKTAALHA